MPTHRPTPTPPATPGLPDPSSLSERYVHAATHRIPEDQRADVADELRASIADQVEALRDHRPDLAPEDAERQVLVSLGDPERMAADYRGRPQYLVGPTVYPAYVRALRAVMAIAVPAVTAVVAVVAALEGDGFGDIVGQSVWTAFSVAVQVAFWVTLVFVLAERGGSDDVRRSLSVDWDPDQLPDHPQTSRGSLGELVANVVLLALFGLAIVWQQVNEPIEIDGERYPALDPDLWSNWLPLLLALLVVEAVFEVVKYALGGWSPTLATVNVLTGAAFAAPLVYLCATERLLSPEAVTAIASEWTEFDQGKVHLVILLVAVAIWVWDSIDGWRKALAAR